MQPSALPLPCHACTHTCITFDSTFWHEVSVFLQLQRADSRWSAGLDSGEGSAHQGTITQADMLRFDGEACCAEAAWWRTACTACAACAASWHRQLRCSDTLPGGAAGLDTPAQWIIQPD